MPAPYLKPCPFCGYTDVYVFRHNPNLGGENCGWVSCDNCEADGPNVHHPFKNPTPSAEEISAAWNKRDIPTVWFEAGNHSPANDLNPS